MGWSAGLISRRGTVYRVAVGCAVLGGGIAGYLYPTAPLLAWWLCCALGFGTYLAFTDAAPGLPTRAARIVLLNALLLPTSLLSTQIAARRLTAATHLRYHGVLIERQDSVTIASGLRHVDVIFPTVSVTQVPWRITLRRGKGGWEVDGGSDAEQIRLSPVRGAPPSLTRRVAGQLRLHAPPFTVANAALLLDATSRAIVRDRAGNGIDTLSLTRDGDRLAIRSSALGTYYLNANSDRLNGRYGNRLRAGVALALLDAGPESGTTDLHLPLDRLLRVQELSPRQEVNGDWPGLWTQIAGEVRETRRFLVTASAPLRIEQQVPALADRRLAIGDSARLEVRHGGGLWRFDVVVTRRAPSTAPGLAIRFVRTPRVFDAPLPSDNVCRTGGACGLLSLRALPPPIAHLALGSAGLDTTRFALLARVHESGDGLTVMMSQRTIPIARGKSFAAIPVTSLDLSNGVAMASADQPTHWVLVSASDNRFEGLWKIALMCGGLVLLLLVVHEMVSVIGASSVRAKTATEKALALCLSAVLTLLITRVIVGARVSLFPPFKDAGLDTAIGMYVAIGTVVFGLLLWPSWAPHVLTLFREFRLRGAAASLRRWSLARAALRRPNESRFKRRRRLPMLWVGMGLALVMLSFASLAAVRGGLLAGLLVLSTWFILAWVSAFQGHVFHPFGDSPSDVIEYDVTTAAVAGASPTRERSFASADREIVVLCLLWATALWSPLLGTVVAFAKVLSDGVRARRAARAPDADDQPRRIVLGALGQFVSVIGVAALKWKSENGAMAAFLFVILVAIASVRIGRSLAARLTRRAPDVATVPASSADTPIDPHTSLSPVVSGRIGWWVVPLYVFAPLVLLGPLAVLDMGLLLVTVIPIGAASLLAVGWWRITPQGRVFVAATALFVFGFLGLKVLFPPIGAIGDAGSSYVQRANAFDRMQGVFGYRLPIEAIDRSLERAAARAVATTDQRAAERLLVAAYPGGARDLLIPSIEQAWGGRAYSAAGLWGKGLGSAPVAGGGHGIAESVSYAENSFAVYVLYEHGAIGGVVLLVTYLAFILAVLLAVRNSVSASGRVAVSASLRASRALFLVAALLVTIPAAYVALSNLGVVPITGQNMPFLGLNAWSDVTLCAGIVGMLLTGALRTQAVQRGGGVA